VLVVIQIALGAWTIWSNKAADIATAHVAMGAGLFVLSGLITVVCYRARYDAGKKSHATPVETRGDLAEVNA
jgi:heme A synthase